MSPVHGGILAARALKQAGVECIFTLCGGHIMPLYAGCKEQGIRIIDVRHEQAAVHAADSWARCNPGKVGVAAITAGPGVTDGVTGIANAWRANSPILVFGGQGPFENLRRGSLQEMDHIGVVRPITKFADAIYQTHRIPEYVELAIRHAVSGIPGPAYLEIPMDVFMGSVDDDKIFVPRIRTASPRLSPDREAVREALALLKAARRPMLMAGTSVKWSQASAAMNRFIAETHIPGYTNGMGRGTIPPDSPEFLNRSRRDALKQIDCILLAGTLLDFRMAFGKTIPADAKVIQLEMDATLIGQNRQSDVGLVGNLACSFELLLEEMKNTGTRLDFSGWRDELRKIEVAAEAKVEAALGSDEVPVDPQRMCREVRDWLDTLDDPIVIGDGGDIVATAAKIIPVKREGAWMDPGPLGTLGVGMPFALAAQASNPGKPVVIIYGDGSFGLNGMEYDTAVRFNLPIIGIVGNDGAWGQMMRPQGAIYGMYDSTLLNYTRYDKVVEALGGYGELVERPDQIRGALQRAAASGKPALINVIIRQDRGRAITRAASTSSDPRLGAREQAAADLGLDASALAPWLAEVGPVAVIDFETTGLVEDAAAEPIELGAVLLDPGSERVVTLERTLRPSGPVPRSVRALTGIGDAELAGAPRLEELADAIATALAGRTLVAHNAAFERHFLARYVAPHLRSARYLDTTELLAFAYPDAPDLRLETAALRLLGQRECHRALPDALAAARLLSLAAAGARDGNPRFAVVRAALERYAPRSRWLALLRGGESLPAPESEPAQYIAIGQTREEPVPFDADAIAAALADAARGRRHFPGYRVREGQIRMAREFVRVLDEGGRLLLEGGTGVGKSLAYLAALIPFALERAAGGVREPVIVSTRTKLLQDQLLAKDIPAAAAMLGHSGLRALSIKGRANYVCERRCQQVLAEGREPRLYEEDRASFAALACAAKLRPHGEIGTLPGALLMLHPPLRDLRQRAVAARAEQCTREQCAGERACPFGRRRKALADAHLVVANHDLLLRWPPDYPAFTCAIVDEAHELAGVADEVYAAEVRPEAVLERVDELFGTGVGRRAQRPRVAVDPAEARGWRADLQADLLALGGMFAERAGEFGGLELPAQAARIFPQAAQTASLAATRLELLARSAEEEALRQAEEKEGSEALERGAAELRDAAASLRAAFADDARDEVVAAFENLAPPYDRWRLALRQVAPARSFHEAFLQKLEAFAAVSASLFVGGDSFAALGELELERYSQAPVWSLRVESPFPYERHMRVVALDAPGDLVEETAGVVEELALLLGGRTLALFTSLRRMRDVRERLADRLRGEGFDLLMPRRTTDDPAALVDRFARAGAGAVLLGSRTFWQGLDIPGPALSAVVIEKLPFEVPTELRRRREARLRAEGSDAFERQALGKMLLNLKQMVGRLIRSEDDRGLVVIVEPRSDRPYFERLGEALPPGCGVRLVTREALALLLDEAGVPRAGGPG